MPKLKTHEVEILKSVEKNFFDVVPQKFETFCALNASIIAATLRHFNIVAKVQPCQLWCATPSNNFIVGFIHETPMEGKWDGHAVCAAKDWIIDAGLSHLRRDHGISVPPIAVIPRFMVRSQTIARADISATERIWWMRPPSDVNAQPPQEPEDVVSACAQALINRIGVSYSITRPLMSSSLEMTGAVSS